MLSHIFNVLLWELCLTRDKPPYKIKFSRYRSLSFHYTPRLIHTFFSLSDRTITNDYHLSQSHAAKRNSSVVPDTICVEDDKALPYKKDGGARRIFQGSIQNSGFGTSLRPVCTVQYCAHDYLLDVATRLQYFAQYMMSGYQALIQSCLHRGIQNPFLPLYIDKRNKIPRATTTPCHHASSIKAGKRSEWKYPEQNVWTPNHR